MSLLYIFFSVFVFKSFGEAIYPDYCWKDINLFSGSSKYPEETLLNAILRTKTSSGREALIRFLASEQTADIDTLKSRQQVIKTIDALELSEIIDLLEAKEKELSSFFDVKSTFYNFSDSVDIIKKFYYHGKNNANKGCRQLFFRKLVISDLYNIFIKQYNNGLSLVCFVASYLLREKKLDALFILAQFIPFPFFREVINIIGTIKLLSIQTKFTISLFLAWLFLFGGLITTILSYIKIIRRYKSYKKIFKQVQDKVVALQTLIYAIIKLHRLISKNPILNSLIPHINVFLDQETSGNALSIFLKTFKTVDFKNVKYFSYNSVVMLALFRAFYDHKELFKNILKEIGEVDMYLSLARLLKEKTNTPWCYTDFILSPKPYVDIADLWNPLIKNANVVTNDVNIGRDFANMILCGHNGGGKSTYLKSLIIAVLLSQTFGICPARKMVMTPFKYIRSMSSINEELADSDSLFMSEIKRLSEYIKLCQSVQKGEFIFTVFDEPLHGTDSTSAVVLLKSIFKFLASNENLLHIISTHYRDVISLEYENNKKFKNYLVQIKFTDDDNFKYTYKVVPGISTRSVALNIAADKGVPREVIAMAKKEQNINR